MLTINEYKDRSFDRICKVQCLMKTKFRWTSPCWKDIENTGVAFSMISSILLAKDIYVQPQLLIKRNETHRNDNSCCNDLLSSRYFP